MMMHPVCFNKFPEKLFHGSNKVFVLTTKKIFRYCYPLFQKKLTFSKNTEFIFIPDGEKHKNFEIAQKALSVLFNKKAGRADVLLCLGGGVVTDLGGFCASVYKRGMRLVHVPTTLLAMADAAVGGKNGLNFHYAKNMIGTLYFPEALIIFEDFLKTLPEVEYANGLTEIFKISLTDDARLFDALCKKSYNKNILPLLKKAIALKMKIVTEDPNEKGRRKVLNFGHTFGHALEAIYQERGKQIPHGVAVATGMALECILSFRKGYLNQKTLFFILQNIRKHLKILKKLPEAKEMYAYMLHDKKNKQGKIMCVGLKSVGQSITDIPTEYKDVLNCKDFYHSWISTLK
ncbi:MAG: 3-dehydroquinate synthase [Bacteroidia bacterium]|nr:3-dehydroquinate synthase [Bacteroidia bacterium]